METTQVNKVNTTIRAELDQTLSEIINLLSRFSQDQFNIIPFKDSWTAGQLAKHVLMSASGFTEMINGSVESTNRNANEKVDQIKSDFLNFNIKMESPDFIKPPVDNYNKDELISQIGHVKESLLKAVETLDLNKTCVSFEIPVIGFLTRIEAASFVLYHTQRHIHQLKHISQKVVS